MGLGLSNESISLGAMRTILGSVNPAGTTALNETSSSTFIQALVCLQGPCPGSQPREGVAVWAVAPSPLSRPPANKGEGREKQKPSMGFSRQRWLGIRKTLLNPPQLLSDELHVAAEIFC